MAAISNPQHNVGGEHSTEADVPHQHDADIVENSKEELDERLDEGLEETFPSSDPVAVIITK